MNIVSQKLLKHDRLYFLFLGLRPLLLVILVISIGLGQVGCSKAPADEESINTDAPKRSELQGNEILPQLERSSEDNGDGVSGEDILIDPFSESFELVGVLVSKSSKDSIAIIESGITSYVVRKDDTIAGYWDVDHIQDDGVLLKHQDKELILKLKGD